MKDLKITKLDISKSYWKDTDGKNKNETILTLNLPWKNLK